MHATIVLFTSRRKTLPLHHPSDKSQLYIMKMWRKFDRASYRRDRPVRMLNVAFIDEHPV